MMDEARLKQRLRQLTPAQSRRALLALGRMYPDVIVGVLDAIQIHEPPKVEGQLEIEH